MDEDPTLAVLLLNIDTYLRKVAMSFYLSVYDPFYIRAKHERHKLIYFIYTYMEARHELVDFIYTYEDDMTKMVLQSSFTTCMNLDVANDSLKVMFHHLEEVMICNNLALLGVNQFKKGGL